jgi:lincosamide nucleotidyltransferase A/C/D/E
MPFTGSDVVEVLDLLEIAGVDARLVGGWGVDALLGERSREHDDLDLLIPLEHDGRLRRALGQVGFVEVRGVPSNYVMWDRRGREVDVHLVRYGPEGDADYRTEAGADWVFPAGCFTRGRIEGRVVACVDGDQQVRDHADGYEPTPKDHADMRRLHERLGTTLVPPYV